LDLRIRLATPFCFWRANFEKDGLRAEGERKMNTTLRVMGAMLLALVLMPAAALASNSTDVLLPHHGGALIKVLFALGALAAGTVTVTYSSFAADNPSPQVGPAFTGGTTPPTAIQSSNVNRVNALVSFTDTDTTITFTHNMGLTAAGAAAQEPDLVVWDTALGSSTTTPSGITWNVANTNVVVGTKANTAGSGRTISITARRPATPGN
jgi:hypothetical protein